MKSKNIHVLKTNNPSKLLKDLVDKTYQFKKVELYGNRIEVPLNIYITDDSEIKDGDYGICLNLVREGFKSHQAVFKMDLEQRRSMEDLGGQKKAEVLKIILTTDPDLIKDGIQAIDDEFLEWFVKNPSCEYIELKGYAIILPGELCDCDNKCDTCKEEKPKQETLEEVAERLFPNKMEEYDIFLMGAKWQSERMYSEEDMREAYKYGKIWDITSFEEWFEQFKKK